MNLNQINQTDKSRKCVQLSSNILNNIHSKETLRKITEYLTSTKAPMMDESGNIDYSNVILIPSSEKDLDKTFERLYQNNTLKSILKSMINKEIVCEAMAEMTYREMLKYTK